MLNAQVKTAAAFASLVALGVAVFGFTFLYVAAGRLGFDAGFMGLSDDTVRTIAHFTVYGSLAFMLARALRNWHLLVWLVSVLAATGEEINQLFINWRFSCVQDWMLNVAGITTFILLSKFAWPWALCVVRQARSGQQAQLVPVPVRADA